MFQSSSGQKAGCNRGGSVAARGGSRFQSSSGQKAGCNAEDSLIAWHYNEFQSSSGQKAGCNIDRSVCCADSTSCFNPHPARRPDATCRRRHLFQSLRGWSLTHWAVSILIRPEGRMQPPCSLGLSRGCSPTFQSSSGQKAGCNGALEFYIWPVGLFQSSSGQKAGCNVLHHHQTNPAIATGFNPHPARRPDATFVGAPGGPAPIVFQSSSGQKAGCNVVDYRLDQQARSFNPHPARRPDATCWGCGRRRVSNMAGFNPHPARRPDAT